MIYVVNWKDDRGGNVYKVFEKINEARTFIQMLKIKGIEFKTEQKEETWTTIG